MIRVAAEGRNVVFNPLQRGDQVQDAVVAGGVIAAFRSQLRVGQVAEDSQPVVQRDDDTASLGKAFAVVTVQMSVALRISSAVEIYADRKLFPGAVCGSPYIEVQAVFAAGPFYTVEFISDQVAAALGSPPFLVTNVPVFVALPDALPGFYRLRRSSA